MYKLQKIWLTGVIIFFSLHIARDILQDLKVRSILSDLLVKPDQSGTPKYHWVLFNTYFIAIAELLLATISLRKNKFGPTGVATVVIAILLLCAWLYYWFIM